MAVMITMPVVVIMVVMVMMLASKTCSLVSYFDENKFLRSEWSTHFTKIIYNNLNQWPNYIWYAVINVFNL